MELYYKWPTGLLVVAGVVVDVINTDAWSQQP